MKIAVFSDIHGNLPALEAVLRDIQHVGVDQMICLGDISNLGPFPRECLEVVRDLGCPTVQGNHELYVLGEGLAENWQTCPTWSPLRWTRSQFDSEHFHFIKSLPFSHLLSETKIPRADFVHGSPKSQFLGITATATDAEVKELMQEIDMTTMFCGHIHIPLLRCWSSSRLVNVGSVGMPLDGQPYAHYVLATAKKNHWHIEFRQVNYNIDLTMQQFETSGLQTFGGLVTAAFRYQMLTGTAYIARYFSLLHSYALKQGQTIAEAYLHQPIPLELEPFFAQVA